MNAAVYATHRRTGTVHLVDSEQLDLPRQPSTLCGLTVRHAFDDQSPWEVGDETLGGIAATCESCRGYMTRRQAASV